MIRRSLFLVAFVTAGLVASPGASHAEKVRTNQDTKLYSRAGEQAPVLLKVKEGKTMTVLAKDGRWIKVRVSGRTGWIPRSKVDLPDDEEITRNTRRRPFVDGRGTRRGFGGENGPDDRVGADAVGEGRGDEPERDEPVAKKKKADDGDEDAPVAKKAKKADKTEKVAKADKKPAKKPAADEEVVSIDEDEDNPEKKSDKDVAEGDSEAAPARPMAHVAKATKVYAKPDEDSDEAFTAEPKVALFLGKTKGEWTRVSTDDGDAGYVQTSELEIDDAGGARRRVIAGRARLGFTLVKQSLTTPGGSGKLPDAYTASSSSVALALGGDVLYPYKDRFWVGGELGYNYNKAVPGINFMAQTIGFTYHVLDVLAVGGYDLKTANGMTVFAHLGLHYDSFQVANVNDLTKNTAKLPSQVVKGPELGGAINVDKLTDKLGLYASLDFIPFAGGLTQTKNLEDGTGGSAKAILLGGRLTYRWKPKIDLLVNYNLMYESISFTGPAPATSQRGHTAMTTSSGSDFNNALSGGIAYAF
ncbi:MAG TPA: SH3 domain-containing protein [Kofleriaceae bacterium]|nr:SH3 domain-containing protein [Kofleriaceae bacterium]